MTNEEHYDEVDRLWRAVKRDLSSAIMEFAGFQDGKALDRLAKNWDKLCELDLDVAGRLYHGVEQVHMRMARNDKPNSPADHQLRQMSELVGMATIAREKHPDADVKALGELLSLGEKSIQEEIDAETGDAK